MRFTEFEEEWKTQKLCDFTERITRKNSDNQTQLPLTISSKDGLVDQVTHFNKQVSSKDMSGYYLLKNGEFAYNKSYSVGYDFGSVKRLDRYPMGALSTLYICFALTKHNSDFMKVYFDSLKWYKEIYMIAAEGARNHGLLNVPTDDFFDTLHILPQNPNEQDKIAKFLILVEKRIEKQQALVDNLKSYKRGLFNLLSNKFLDNSPQVKLFEIVECLDSKRIPINSSERSQKIGSYPYYGANGIQGYIDQYIFDGEYVLLAEDGGHFDDFTENAIAQYVKGKIWVNNHAHILQTSHCNTKFLFYMLEHKDIRSYINGTSRAKLNQEDMLQISIPMPSREIQDKISTILMQIDNEICIANSIYQRLGKYKKGLLQRLFI